MISWIVDGRVGQDRQHDAQEPVGRDLRQHGGEDGQRRQRHLAVRVGHPAVHQERRHLDQERQREADEQQPLRAVAEADLVEVGEHERQRRVRLPRAQHRRRHRRGEHQQRPDERVDDHLDRRRPPLRPAPPEHQEQERHEHQVEESDEQRQVLGDERAEHGGLGERHQERERGGPVDRPDDHPQRRGREQQRGQGDEPQVQAVDPELVADAERRDPRVVGDVLQAVARVIEVEQHDHRERERDRAFRRAPDPAPRGRAAARRRPPRAIGANSTMERWTVTS